MLDRDRLRQAFEMLGEELARQQVFLELAVYGGSAMLLQFSWRRATEDVDAVVREGYDESLLAPSVARVAQALRLPPDWLNNAVGMFTPLVEPDALFDNAGTYPRNGAPGLRVLVARPHYLLAMKLGALSSLDRGDRDLIDARDLAAELGIVDRRELEDLYRSIHGENARDEVARHFPAVLKRP